MSKRVVEGCYARLCGIRDSMPSNVDYIPLSFLTDYEQILGILRSLDIDIFVGFDLTKDVHRDHDEDLYRGNKIPLELKLNQLIRYLEMVHQTSAKIVEIGSIYNAIKDAELKSRCGDLLSAADHFDRVINQATQVLEERVRQLVPTISEMTGGPLVGKAINAEPSKSMIIFSSNPNEQEGYAALFKGLIAAFRNPTHHKFLESVTREQALQICAFIDNMLAALATAQVAKQ